MPHIRTELQNSDVCAFTICSDKFMFHLWHSNVLFFWLNGGKWQIANTPELSFTLLVSLLNVQGVHKVSSQLKRKLLRSETKGYCNEGHFMLISIS